jgi:DNA-binding NarL/FixJ family response regulator
MSRPGGGSAVGQLVRVLLVDDHPLWRETLRGVLEHDTVAVVVGEAADGDEAVRLAAETGPDVVLMDIGLEGIDGITATSRILAANKGIRVLVLSSSDDKRRVLDAVRAGASGYLLKTAGSAEIASGVQRVHAGELVFPPALARVVLAELRSGGFPGDEPVAVGVVATSALDRRGLAAILADGGFDVLWSVDMVRSCPTEAGSSSPHVVVVQQEPQSELVGTAAALRELFPAAGQLLLVDDRESAVSAELFGLGTTTGLLRKGRVSDGAEVTSAVRRLASGESVIDAELASALVAGREPDLVSQLTQREREVLALMAEGRSNQAICDRLHLSGKTIEGHVGSIFSKLGLEATPDDHRRVLAVVTYLRAP